MNKSAAIVSALAIAGAIWFFAGPAPAVKAQHPPARSEAECEIYEVPRGKALYVVVDRDGVYLGDQRFDLAGAKVGIAELLKRQKIRNLAIYGTDLARYGDVIDLYTTFDSTQVHSSWFSFRPLPIGTRKPLTGYFKPICCFSDDVENHDPAEIEPVKPLPTAASN